ncbi:hypothetical protein FB2170_14598 [Maribacter sp. HTCC2170]|nr:hypothetical protein FB2170_14598 [Maribacter sp. HTCC2170]
MAKNDRFATIIFKEKDWITTVEKTNLRNNIK